MNSLWDILSVAIGISFIFMILSILNSWIQDYIATLFDVRAQNLADILQNLLEPGATKLKGIDRAKAPPEILESETSQNKTPSRHVLKNEDNLNRIAEYLQVSVADLRDANLKTLDKWLLPDGTNLLIPEILHKVEGELNTLEKMAIKYGTTTNSLLTSNPTVLDELLLPVDTELKIPETAYTVAGSNNTLNSVAETYGRSLDTLLQANRSAFEKVSLPAGTTLNIPELSYKVMDNEKAQDIAANFGVSGEALKAANPNVSLDAAMPGTLELTIPGTTHTVEGSVKTLTEIAKKYGRSMDVLQDKNLEILKNLPLPKKTVLTIPELLHEVEGDSNTLKDIATRYGQSIDILRKGNRKKLKTLPLLVWSELKIPEVSHSVERKVNTLETIAKKYGRTTDSLWIANLDMLSELSMPINTRLTIPDPNENRYTVLADDTLSSIALAFGISMEDLQKANPNRAIQAGSTLMIPRPQIGQMVSRKNVLMQLLANPVGTLYRHPIINSLSKPNKLPDRIPTKDFTVALIDLLDDVGRGKDGKKSTDRITMASITKGIAELEKLGRDKQHPLAFRLRSILYTAQINTQIKAKVNEAEKAVQADMEEFQKAVSDWFDDTVARGSVWYKRRMQVIGILCGFILAIALNADTLGLSNALWHNAILRESITQAAQAAADKGKAPDSDQAKEDLNNLLNLGLPLGWTFDWADKDPDTPDNPRDFPSSISGWFTKVVGLFLTGLAISQGSQLWFDLMNRLLNLRSPGSPSNAEEPREKERSKQG